MQIELGFAVASAGPQFTVNLPCKGLNNLHPQSCAGAGVKPLRQSRTIIGNRKSVTIFRIPLQPYGDPALSVLRCIRDQLACDEAEWNGGGGRQIDFNAFDDNLLRDSAEDTIAEKSRLNSARNFLNSIVCTPS